MPRQKFVQIESKNAILEMLQEGKPIDRLYIALNAYKDPKTREIVELARKNGVEIIDVSRKSLNRITRTGSIESVVAMTKAENQWGLRELLDKIHTEGLQPFFILLDHLKYEQNIGALMRTAYAAGVNGIITPVSRDSFITTEAIRISMGAALRIPIVEMSLFESLKELKRDGVKVLCVTMDGTSHFQTDLKGPIAFVLGAEDVGISTKMLEKSDGKVSIPMREGIGSLNVAASAAIICYEKLRQEVA